MKPHIRLVSFVGITDGLLAPEGKGPIITAVRHLKPDHVVLIVTEGASDTHDYIEYARRVKQAIQKLNPKVNTKRVTMELNDPTDHNEIYPKLRDIVRGELLPHQDIVAAISSGTPSMQVCWVLLAESEDAPIRLVRTVDPALSKNVMRDVKLGIELPKIVSLKEENIALREIALPEVVLHAGNATVTIGDVRVDLSPRQFTYYRYFLERARKAKSTDDHFLRVTGIFVEYDFAAKIQAYHFVSFPESVDLEMDRLKKSEDSIEVAVFRSNVTKTNDRIRKSLHDPRLTPFYVIHGDGPKSARRYGIQLEPSKIKIISR